MCPESAFGALGALLALQGAHKLGYPRLGGIPTEGREMPRTMAKSWALT